jgi:DNA repair exonuclease SbcCD nuclease subunit
MSIKILHTADWQIGKQFSNVPGDAGAALRLQRFETIKAIARAAAAHSVDAVLVAGDVFEDNAVSDETLRRTMNALEEYQGPWVLLPGNHDSAIAQSAWERLRSLDVAPENVIIADAPDPIFLKNDRVVVLPAPLQRRHEARDLTDWFDDYQTEDGVIRIGLAHGSVTNRLPEQAEALNPVAEDRAQTANLDYLALGDWHGTLGIAPKSWYAGTPEQDRFRANDPGNVVLVEIPGSGEPPRVTQEPIGRYDWHQLSLDLLDDESIQVLESQLASFESPESCLLRLKLKGAVDLAQRSRIDQILSGWQAKLHFMDVQDAELLAQPSAEDIAAMGATGFLRDAIEALTTIQADVEDPEHESASLALQILYMEQGALAR